MSNALRGLIIGTWVAGLVWLENKRALRPVRRSKIQRDARNLAVAVPAGAVMQFIEAPVAFWLAEQANRSGLGLLPWLPIPAPLKTLPGVILLDYTLYWWHFLTHRVPVLWRFHQVHHLDEEMDATTALRFHFGEIGISVLFRAAQIVVIGPTPFAIALWQLFLFLCILFHHSNVRLPVGLERTLARVLITPRLHGIHHSIVPAEVNSNWSSGLSFWDWLHGTLRTEPPQDQITIGLPGRPAELCDGLGEALALPFRDGGAVPPYDGRPLRQSIQRLG
jgi:sterol desaturase/sphingolipid hydroxylase (fatty acid hydroxylase superfamily)